MQVELQQQHDTITKLRAEVEELRKDRERLAPVILIMEQIAQITPKRPNAITWERGNVIVTKVQDELCPAIDAAKENK
jgi:hypothetical protein